MVYGFARRFWAGMRGLDGLGEDDQSWVCKLAHFWDDRSARQRRAATRGGLGLPVVVGIGGENLIEFCKPAHIWDRGSARWRRAATRGAWDLGWVGDWVGVFGEVDLGRVWRLELGGWVFF
jgi:hypothetical protein